MRSPIKIHPTPTERRRIEAGARHLATLGSRALCELLIEVAPPAVLIEALDQYRQLTPELLRLVGGDRFAPSLSPVPDDRRAA